MGVSALELRRRVLMAQPHMERKAGSIVSFDTHVPQTLPISVDLPTVQVGTGNPSLENIRPFIGRTGVNIGDAGKNIFGGIALANAVVSSMPSATIDPDSKFVSFAASATVNHPIVGISADSNDIYGFEFAENKQYTFIITCYKNSGRASNLRITYTDGTTDEFPYLHEVATKETIVLVSAPNKTIHRFNKRNMSGTTRIYYEESGIFEGELTAEDFEEWVGTVYPVTFPALGKNLFGDVIEQGTYRVADGIKGNNTKRVRAANGTTLQPGTYTISCAGAEKCNIFFYDVNDVYIGVYSDSELQSLPFTFTLDSARKVKIIFAHDNNAAITPSDVNNIQLEEGSSATSYEPFDNTVYGGVLNLATRVLTVEWRKLIFTSSTSVSNTGTTDTGTWCTQSISASGGNQGYGGNTPNAGNGNGMFSVGRWRYSAVSGEQRAYYRNSTVKAVLHSTEHNMKTAAGRQAFYDAIGGSAEVVYRIKTPRTYQLTPAEIRALMGINYVFSDAGDVDVEFWTN